MKKRSFFVLFTVLVLCVSMMIGCKSGDNNQADSDNTAGQVSPEPTDAPTPEPAKTFKVTFYDSDGTTVLSEEEVEEGKTATEYTPEKENNMFMGWFGTPTMAHEYDFSTPITADTAIFAGFLQEVEDTRTFAIVGSGKSPLLSVSNWGKTINEEHYLTKQDGENVYSITLDLFEGDEFQFAIDTTWANQRGAGYMTSGSENGVEYFASSGGLSASTRKSNIKCLVAGNYTLTLTTNPGADEYDTENEYYSEETKENHNFNPYDSITFTYNGEASNTQVDVTTSYYIKGAIITDWQDNYEEMYGFTEENGIHTLVITLEEGDEFLFTSLVTSGENSSVGNEYVRYSNITDETSLSYLDGSESYNMITKAAGEYTFVYNPETTELTVSFTAR